MKESILLSSLFVINVQSFTHVANHHVRAPHPTMPPTLTQSVDYSSQQHNISLNDNALIQSTSLYARPKSKWDDLIDEDDDDENEDETTFISTQSNNENYSVPPDMLYTEANIRRQANTYDQLESIGGNDVINDVYVRSPGGKEWWLVGKIARISDVSPEQSIERQWPLIERHVWAIRLPVRPTSNLSTPFEVWYARGDSELDAARNDPNVQFTKVSNELLHRGAHVQASSVGFVGKAYDERVGEPLFFVERNLVDGSCLTGMKMEGDWVLRSELEDV
mmetsp:Transcript_24915/g.53747  ORF Transcript_24915/g.53747 Transcript_24915/m.53747 type:complete len:278 (-) Transcript_24915:169-1002(-)|eukprot:CAMPEP_0172312432 /NCGR_PEP_ID=MMETSP1058-20130122/17490_1 /TAXON_ID=83371 /ORGANISM="Detonula confervacea, Strain CCMP 353" /LENGTH=277 /DNA_ID=CAMNT_0013025883 /DNA_START=44 /DNA_END=877 /DNA_ORIENTATION=-